MPKLVAFATNDDHPERAMSFGQRVRTLRCLQAKKQDELAAASGVAQSLVSRIENESVTDPSLSTMSGLARGLGVSMFVLTEAPLHDFFRATFAAIPNGVGRLMADLFELDADAFIDLQLKYLVRDARANNADHPPETHQGKALPANIAAALARTSRGSQREALPVSTMRIIKERYPTLANRAEREAVADELGITLSQLYNAASRLRVTRVTPLAIHDAQLLRDMVKQGAGLIEMASALGVSPELVEFHLRQRGLNLPDNE